MRWFRILCSCLLYSITSACWEVETSPEAKIERSDLVLLAQSSSSDHAGKFYDFVVASSFDEFRSLSSDAKIRVGPIKPICSKIQPKTWYILFLNTPSDLEDVYAFAFHPIAATLENVEYYEKIMKGEQNYFKQLGGGFKEDDALDKTDIIKRLQKRSSPEQKVPPKEDNDINKTESNKYNQTTGTIGNKTSSTAPSKTLPSPRPSPIFKTLPPARIATASPPTLPPSRSRISKVLPSPRTIVPSRTRNRGFTIRRTIVPGSRSRLPRPQTLTKKTLPQPVKFVSRRILPQPRGRSTSRELPLVRRVPPRSVPASSGSSGQRIPSRSIPAPSRFLSRRLPPSSRVSSSAMPFIHISETTKEKISRNNETVVGCPTMIGSFHVTNITRNEFKGYIHVSSEDNLVNGWMLQMKFNIPLRSLSCDTLDKMTCSTNQRDFCFVPKSSFPSVNSVNENLTVYFSGDFSGLRVRQVRSSVKLMGICSQSQMTRNNGSAPRDFANERPAIIEETSLSESASPSAATSTLAPALRCLADSPNGVLASQGSSEPSWLRRGGEGTIDYTEIIHKSVLFYEAQRSGRLTSENRISWRGDSDLKDGCSIKQDLTGGWYSSGGNVKSTPLIAFSTTLLAWGAIEYRGAYMESGEMSNVLKQIRWATDYLIKTRTSPTSLIIQIGDYKSSFQDWSRPEQSAPSSRTLYIADSRKPAADVAGEVAAALAAASILFNQTDSNYAQSCLDTAMDLYQFSLKHQRRYNFNRNAVYSYGRNHNFREDVAWAALWLHRATGDNSYLNSAENFYQRISRASNLFSMKQKSRAITIMLAIATGNSRYTQMANLYINWFHNRASRNSERLLYVTSAGANMYTANAAFLALQAAQHIGTEAELNQTQETVAQLMATLVGLRGQGYVVGVGERSPEQPYHRGSVCPTPPSPCTRSLLTRDEANPHVLYGALVSGVDRKGRYNDRASDSLHNRVRIDYNAGFQGLAAAMLQLSSRA